MKSSRLPGFYKLDPEERLGEIADFCKMGKEDVRTPLSAEAAGIELADRMIENAVGTFQIPLGIAANLLINGKDYLVPMATEEPSVVAAAGNAARLAREGGGFTTGNTGSMMRAQIQVTDVSAPRMARLRLLEASDELLALANEQDPTLVKLGGGAQDLEVQLIDSKIGVMVIAYLIVDVRDAMGANTVNTMAEALGPRVAEIADGAVHVKVLSNLADLRLARAWTMVPKEALGGEEVVDAMLIAHELAEADPYRAATHNKGVMNGVTAVVLATGNDTRAVEAGAHAWAARSGRYRSLTFWEKDTAGNLVGGLEMPLAVGLVGGATRVHPAAGWAVRVLGVEKASELAEVIAAVGLAQNLAAIRILATEGVQRGHMSLHAKNVASASGATPEELEKVAAAMVREQKVRQDRAEEILREMRS